MPTDSERLDWLEAHKRPDEGWLVTLHKGELVLFFTILQKGKPTLRDAIDAAMEADDD